MILLQKSSLTEITCVKNSVTFFSYCFKFGTQTKAFSMSSSFPVSTKQIEPKYFPGLTCISGLTCDPVPILAVKIQNVTVLERHLKNMPRSFAFCAPHPDFTSCRIPVTGESSSSHCVNMKMKVTCWKQQNRKRPRTESIALGSYLGDPQNKRKQHSCLRQFSLLL